MTLKKFLVLTAILCLPIVFYSCDKGGKKVLLRFKFAPGDKITYEQTTKGTHKTMVDDSIYSDRSEVSNSQIQYELLPETTDSSMVVRQTGTTQKSVFNKIDSTSHDTTFSEEPFVFTINQFGRVVDFEMDSTLDTAIIVFMRSFIEQSMTVFPAQEVTQGFTWAQDSRAAVGSKEYQASTNYELVSFVRELGYDCAVIEYKGELRLPIDPAPTDSLGYRGMSFVSTTGVLYFAYREGLLVLQKERWLRDGRFEILDKADEDSLFVGIEWDIVVKLAARTTGQQ